MNEDYKEYSGDPFRDGEDVELIYIVDAMGLGQERIVATEKILYWINNNRYFPNAMRLKQYIENNAGRYEEQEGCARAFNNMLLQMKIHKKIQTTYFVNDKQDARDALSVIMFITSNIKKLEYIATTGKII